MPSLKPLKSFVHNVADSYLSTYGWQNGAYVSTWVYRAAVDSGLHYLEIDIFNRRIIPNDAQHSDELLYSIDDFDERFVKMINSSGITRESVKSLVFKFYITEFLQDKVNFVCSPEAIDLNDKLHRGKPIYVDYIP